MQYELSLSPISVSLPIHVACRLCPGTLTQSTGSVLQLKTLAHQQNFSHTGTPVCFFAGFPTPLQVSGCGAAGGVRRSPPPQKTAVSPRALWMRHRGAGRERVSFPETRRTWVNETSFSNISAMIRKHTCSLPDEKEQQLDI